MKKCKGRKYQSGTVLFITSIYLYVVYNEDFGGLIKGEWKGSTCGILG